MRSKRRNTGIGVFIDLTSLLDIIFILLSVVMCSYYSEQQNAISAQESLSAAIADAEANSQIYSDMMETQNDLQNFVWTASIVVPYEPDEITLRHIKVLREDTEIMSIELVGNDVEDNIKKFKDSLTEYVKGHPDRPVIISLNENNDSILYRDERAVNEILNELAGSYSNVYIKGSISEE